MSRSLAAGLGAALLLFGGAAAAQQPAPFIGIRTGNHPTFTRVVFDWPQAVGYSVVQTGEAAEIRFVRPARLDMGSLARPLRNLRVAEATADGLVLALRPGVRVRHLTVGTSVVVDLLDPVAAAATAPPPAATPTPPRGATARPADVPVPPPPVAPSARAGDVARDPPAPVPAPPAAAPAPPPQPPVAAPSDGAPALREAPRPPVLGAAAPSRASDDTALAGDPSAARAGMAPPLREPAPRALIPSRLLDPPPATAPPAADAAAPATPATVAAPPRLDLPDLPLADLLRQSRDLLLRLAATPAAARGPLRLELAQTLLALGLGQEAQAAWHLATAEEPPRNRPPPVVLLGAAAAILAGRAEEARDLLADPRLPPTGEPALWRGLAGLLDDGAAPADPAFRAALPLLAGQPAALRARLLPPLAAALAEAGARTDAEAVLAAAAPADPAPLLAYARARLHEMRGETEPALAAHAALAAGRDRDARARALGRLAELRLATGQIDAAAAATALEAAIPAWRGDRRELDRRLRAAALRLQAGQPAAALELLRDSEANFPDAADALRPLLRDAVLGVLADPATSPLDAARLVTAQQGALPSDPRLAPAVARIAERLVALELPQEAVSMLRAALPGSSDAGGLAVRLAEALLAEGDAAGALEALRGGEGGAALPGEIGRRRALAEATARRQLGDRAGAAGVLRALGAEGAASLSDLLAESQDWAGAAQALGQHLAWVAPEGAPLDEASRRDLLRQAAFLALAGDRAGLTALRDRYAARLPAGAFAEALGALATGTPGPLDLARLRQEIAGTRALQDQLRALR